MVILTGDFDMLNWVDESTGEMTSIIGNLYGEYLCIFMCDEGTKDCDFWRTSAYDATERILYFQAHLDDGSGFFTTSIQKMGWTENKVNGLW